MQPEINNIILEQEAMSSIPLYEKPPSFFDYLLGGYIIAMLATNFSYYNDLVSNIGIAIPVLFLFSMLFETYKFERDFFVLIGLYLWILAGSVLAEYQKLSLFSTFYLLKVQFILIVVAMRCRSFKRMRFYLFTVIVGTAFLIIPSLFSAAYINYDSRLEGATGASNSLGHITATSIVIWALFLIFIKSWWKRLLFLAMCVISFRVLILTASRGGFIVVAGCIVLVSWLIWKRGKLIIKIALPVLLIVGFHFLILFGKDLPLIGRLAAIPLILGFNIESDLVGAYVDVSRLEIIKIALHIFSRHPFIGAGYGTFGAYSPFDYTHTTPFELLFATGLVGTILYYYVIFSAFYILHKAKKIAINIPHIWNNIEICQVLLIAQLFAGISIPTLASKIQAVVSGVWLGVAWYMRSWVKQQSDCLIDD